MARVRKQVNLPPWMLSGGMDAIVEFLSGQGIDPEEIVGAEGIRIAEASDPYRRVDLKTVMAAFEKTAEVTGRPDIGLEIGLKLDVEEWGPFFFLFLNAPSVRAAFKDLSRYGSILQSQALFRLLEDKEYIGIEYASHAPQLQGWDVDNEISICIFMNMVNRLAGKRWVPAKIQFQHMARCDMNIYRKWLGITPQFGTGVNCILYPAKLNRAGIPGAKPTLYKIMKRHMRDLAEQEFAEDSLLSFVRNNINRGLNSGTATLPHIAAELGMPERTLQRRLSEEGTSFAQLVEDTRMARARYYLQRSTLNITDIAMELGYAEASAFVRAFKRRRGVTPNRYRSNFSDRS